MHLASNVQPFRVEEGDDATLRNILVQLNRLPMTATRAEQQSCLQLVYSHMRPQSQDPRVPNAVYTNLDLMLTLKDLSNYIYYWEKQSTGFQKWAKERHLYDIGFHTTPVCLFYLIRYQY